MNAWKKRYLESYRAHCPTPYLLDRIKSRLVFGPAAVERPSRPLRPFVLFIAAQAFAAVVLILAGASLVSGADGFLWPYLVTSDFIPYVYYSHLRTIGIIVIGVGGLLLAVDAVCVWRHLKDNRDGQR